MEIPELSLWMGGVYECMVGVVKTSLKKALGTSGLNYEQLRTSLVEVELIVNSRPITFVGMSPLDADVEVLTPQKFLSVGSGDSFPILPENDPQDRDYEPTPSNQSTLLANWRVGQFYLNQYWEIWSKAYLSSLREKHASDKFPNVKSQLFCIPNVSEVVLVKIAKLPRSSWKLGRVVELNISRDLLVRSAKVKLMGSKEIITRSVTLLYPLEIQEFVVSDFSQKSKLNSEIGCDPSLPLLDISLSCLH